MESFILLFFTEKASMVIYKEVKLSPDSKIIKLLTFDCCRRYGILEKARSRKTTAITFSRQNGVASCVSNTQYRTCSRRGLRI